MRAAARSPAGSRPARRALGDVRLLARSDASAWQAEEEAQALAAKVDGGSADRIKVTTDPKALAGCDLVVEAIVEELDAKAELLRRRSPRRCPEADLATTTSSLSVGALAALSGHPDRVSGPARLQPAAPHGAGGAVPPEPLRDGAADRARRWCEALGKTVVRFPTPPASWSTASLFPYLFDAVRLLDSTGMEPADVDTCMRLGAGHPMGPLALLDFVGLDVAVAIGDSLEAETGDPATERPTGSGRWWTRGAWAARAAGDSSSYGD